MKIIEHEGFKELQVNFKEFIKLIRPDDKSEIQKYLPSEGYKLIFRGQSNSNHDLTPSAFREDISYSSIVSNYYDLCFRQYIFLGEFVNACDLTALSIPSDSHGFREQYFGANANCYHPNIWPDKGLYELIGLAQHYGYPTEFLDWSYNPLVACFFAASGVIKNTKKIKAKDSLSIWVFDTSQMFKLNQSQSINVELINIPRSLNVNISAQEGCFTLVRQKFLNKNISIHENGKIQGIRRLSDVMHEMNQPGLLKITLKQLDSIKVIDYCSSYRVNASTLFRGYEGAAKYATDSINYNMFKVINHIKGYGIPI